VLDINGSDLFLDLNILRKRIGLKNDKVIDILKYYFLDVYIVYRTTLTILVV